MMHRFGPGYFALQVAAPWRPYAAAVLSCGVLSVICIQVDDASVRGFLAKGVGPSASASSFLRPSVLRGKIMFRSRLGPTD